MKTKSLYLVLVSLFLSLSSALSSADPFATYAGFASQDITPQSGSHAGYGYGERRKNVEVSLLTGSDFFIKGEGTLSSIRVKVAYFYKNGQALVWLSFDTVGITLDFYEDLLKRLKPEGLNRTNLFISATHTHSGPGNLIDNSFWVIAAMDRYHRDYHEHVLQAAVNTIRTAREQAQQTALYSLTVKTKNLQVNRRKAGDYVDPDAHLILAKGMDGRFQGALINYAIHGTALGPENFLFSSDVPGGIEHSLEKALGLKLAVFSNGIEGDVAPIQNGAAGIELVGSAFAAQVLEALPAARPLEFKLETQEISFDLPVPHLDIKKCTTFSNEKGLQTTPLGFSSRIKIPLETWIPRKTTIWHVRFGDLNFLTWPGEPTSSIGLELKQIAESAGLKNVWVFGLTNDYHAYFPSPTEFDANTYESCFSLHGRGGAGAVLDKFNTLLKAKF